MQGRQRFAVNGAAPGVELVGQGSFVIPGIFSIPLQTPIRNLLTNYLTALGLVADRLRSLREQPQSVLFYSASGTKGLMNGVATSFWRLYGVNGARDWADMDGLIQSSVTRFLASG